MSDTWKAYDCLKYEGYTHLTVNYSLNFVRPYTGAHTQGIENTWWGVKRSMRRTGTSKDLFESYLQEWLWRQHYGDDPFWKHNQAYRRLIWSTQRCVNSSVPGTTVCTVRDLIVASWRKETKYTASTHGNEFEEGNQGEKTTKDTMKVFAMILFLFVLIQKNYNYSRWPDQHLIANRKQPAVLRPKTLFFLSLARYLLLFKNTVKAPDFNFNFEICFKSPWNRFIFDRKYGQKWRVMQSE